MLKMLEKPLRRIPNFKDQAEASLDYDPMSPQVQKQKNRITPSNEQAVVDEVLKFYKDAQLARSFLERDWLLAMAYHAGHQWVNWNSGYTMLMCLYDHDDPEERYRHVTFNVIQECMLLVGAAVTQNRPDVNYSPLTLRPIDTAATHEARAINDHCAREFCDEKQLRAIVDLALTSTTAFLYQYWDPKKEEYVPKFDEAGNIAGYAKLEVGGIREEVVPAYYIYPDPKATSWQHCPCLCHVSIRDMMEMVDEYGDIALGLEPDTFATPAGFIESRLDWINKDYGSATHAVRKNAVTVYSMWDKPNDKFPKGRYIVVASNRVLRYEDWPYEDKENFPFLPLGFQEMPHTLWALNNVSRLIEPQMAYNRMWSRYLERIKQDKLVILLPRGSEIGTDGFESDRQKEIIYFNPMDPATMMGGAPAFQQPPPINPEWMGTIQALKMEMQELSGARDVSRGLVPTGVTAATAIQLLQVANASQLSPFLGNIERFVQQRAERRVALYAQYVDDVPRLVGVSEDADTASAAASVQAFRALRAGGRCRVVVTPGSAKPSSPDAMNERIMEFYKAGMCGPPLDPGSAIIAWRAMEHAKSDIVIEDLMQLRQAMIAEEQAKAQAQAQGQANPLMAAKQLEIADNQQRRQHEAELEAIRHAHELQTIDAKSRLELAKLSMEQTHDAEKLALAHHHEIVTRPAKD